MKRKATLRFSHVLFLICAFEACIWASDAAGNAETKIQFIEREIDLQKQIGSVLSSSSNPSPTTCSTPSNLPQQHQLEREEEAAVKQADVEIRHLKHAAHTNTQDTLPRANPAAAAAAGSTNQCNSSGRETDCGGESPMEHAAFGGGEETAPGSSDGLCRLHVLALPCLCSSPSEVLPNLINPWGWSLLVWCLGFVCIRLGVLFWDWCVHMAVHLSGRPLLPTRLDGRKIPFYILGRLDMFYMALNSVNEFVFVINLCHFVWFSPLVSRPLSQLGLFNTIAALGVMFVAMDVVYAPAHRFMHWRPVYGLVHQHHHQQAFPARGYLDAGNEHPVEHMIGVGCAWVGVLSASLLTSVHAATIMLFFNVHAALAMLNHSPYDIRFKFPGFEYSVGAHEMHHRKRRVNYAQYFMAMDKLMGTYVPYST